VKVHGRRHRGRVGPRVGTRWYERETVLERLEEYRRDLEQELADVSDLIDRLRTEASQPQQ